MVKIKRIIIFFLFIILSMNRIFADSGITLVKLNKQTEVLLDFEESQYEEKNYGIEIKISGRGFISAINNSKRNDLSFETGNSAEKLYIYPSLTGFSPNKLIIKSDSDFDLISARIISLEEEQPLIADIGHIIFSEFEPKNEDWIIYKWNMNPEILIFDTRNYATQSRLFKRLAFFVEKKGFIGTLQTNENLKNRHGWNAHDYKPDDIAAFFNESNRIHFTLDKEELKLKEILLNHGVIIKEGDFYKGGSGAVLSVSRQSPKNRRYRFLTHECLHGLFFTNKYFREDVYDVFFSLQPQEISFWKNLLNFKNYDAANNYLLVNEYMAYSLQQPVEDSEDYFKNFLYKEMIAANPNMRKIIEEFDNNFPHSFKESVQKLEAVLKKYTGFKAGNLANLCPVTVKESFYDLFP